MSKPIVTLDELQRIQVLSSALASKIDEEISRLQATRQTVTELNVHLQTIRNRFTSSASKNALRKTNNLSNVSNVTL